MRSHQEVRSHSSSSSLRGLRSRLAAVAVTAAVGGLGVTGSASAQTAAGSQYSGGAATSAANAAALKQVQFVSFGTGDRAVRADVRRALDEAGIPFDAFETTDARIKALIASTYAKTQLSTAGPKAVGTAAATRLAKTGDPTATIFKTLFPGVTPKPVTAVVLSRGDNVSPEQVEFLKGLAGGFGAVPIPTVYAERSDDKRPHLDEYRGIKGVGIVDNVDTAAGRQRLAALITGGTANEGDTTISADTKAAVVQNAASGDSDVATPIALIVLLLGAGGVVVAGVFRRKRV